MKRLIALLLALIPATSEAQFSARLESELKKMLSPAGYLRAPVYVTASLPACGSTNQGAFAYDDTLNLFTYCDGTGWVYSFTSWPLLAPDGSISAPSYSFAGEPTAGIYRTAGSSINYKSSEKTGLDQSNGERTNVFGGRGTGTGTGSRLNVKVYTPFATSSSTQHTFQSGLFIDGDNGEIQLGGDVQEVTPGPLNLLGLARSGTDLAGGNTALAGGRGTGAGNGGNMTFQLTPPGATGTTLNTPLTVATWSGANGSITLGGQDWPTTVATSTWAAADRAAGATDVAGASLTLRSGQGTGAAAATSIAFQTPTVGVSGTSQQTLATRFTVATDALTATVPHRAADGAESAPSYSFTSGTSSGLFNSGTQTILKGEDGSGTDAFGFDTYLFGGKSTGTAGGGAIRFNITPAGTGSGSGLNSYAEVFRLASNGGGFIGGLPIAVAGAITTLQVVGGERATGFTDGAGGDLQIQAGRGTGSGAASSVRVLTPTVGVSGTSQQATTTRLTINSTGIGATVPILEADGLIGAPSYSFTNAPSAGGYIGASGGTNWKGEDGSGTDSAGAGAAFQAGRSTGAGNGGNVQLNLTLPSATGSALNSYQTPFFASGTNGLMTVGSLEVLGTPGAMTVRAPGRPTGVSNGAGALLDLESGISTGNATPPEIRLRTTTTGVSGSAQQAYANRLVITETAVTATVPFIAPAGSSTAPAFGWSSANRSNAGIYSPSDTYQIWKGQDASGTDASAATNGRVDIRAGRGTGTGDGGDMNFYIAMPSASSGSGLNTEQQWAHADPTDGSITLGNLNFEGNPSVMTIRATAANNISNQSAAGADLQMEAGAGTGTGVGGDIIGKVAPAGTSGSSQNPRLTAFTIRASDTHVRIGEATDPSLSACGTTPSVTSGGDHAGKILTGSTAITSCTLTFARAFAVAPACIANDETTIQVVRAVSTTTTVTFDCSGAGCLESDTISYWCIESN